MDGEAPDYDLFSQIDDVKNIQIKNFSSVLDYQNEHIHFVRKKYFYGLYAVHVYPDGASSEDKGYVSIKVSKVLKDPVAIPDVGYDNITWTFSVVDFMGRGRYYQSIAKESVVNLPYRIEIPKFLGRSFILERADELLPSDELTIRCEVSFVFYSIQAFDEDLVFDVKPYGEIERIAENINEDSKGKKSSETDSEEYEEVSNLDGLSEPDANFFEDFEKGLNLDESSENDDAPSNENLGESLNRSPFSKTGLNQGLELFDTEEDIIYYILIMLSFLHEYNECKQKRKFDSKDLEFQIRLLSKILANTDNADEIAKTYMWTDPLFKAYIHLKSKTKEILSKFPLEIREEDLKNEKYNRHPIYTQGSSITFSESYSMMTKISEVIKRMKNPSYENENKHSLAAEEYNYLMNIVPEVTEQYQMWEYLFEAFRSDESNLSDEYHEEQGMTDMKCNQDKDWNLLIETEDGVILNISFQKGKETLGSRLVACSSVFESMLRNPMSERLSKKVHLSDISFRTFKNFLLFLQGNGIVTSSFSELCDLYEMADKYNVKDLMFDCGLMFKPFLSEETVPFVEALASMHSDEFLLNAIKSFKTERSDNPILKDDSNFVVKFSTNTSVKEKRSDFDFYQ